MTTTAITAAARKPRIMTHAERVATYGEPVTAHAGALVASAAWEARALVRVEVPWPHPPGVLKIKVHRLAADVFGDLFRRWFEAGLLPHLLTFDGTHNPRMKRGHETSLDMVNVSTHAFGAAIDLNARQNPFGKPPAAAGKPGSLVELVPIAHACGFVWGGHFSTARRDGMHFELGVLDQERAVPPALG